VPLQRGIFSAPPIYSPLEGGRGVLLLEGELRERCPFKGGNSLIDKEMIVSYLTCNYPQLFIGWGEQRLTGMATIIYPRTKNYDNSAVKCFAVCGLAGMSSHGSADRG